ncbi:hypothetical protein BA768_08335 [Chryseobacterium sp. CBo1]|uniref:DUF1016 N-terminal domain-containing protein n=1 Tax=Chryseobacterium sp. CBo1 TaxID=1869230 RepID=UPI000810926E|nr:DUF1016 N-terminal domain-containing protein [Chryseobacterium sp. CBo1]OCK49598.1 hypothetical protein BA768_08335 [Chryseobacterium sp. CBo1]
MLENSQIQFISKIKNKVRNAQYEAMKAVNVALINLYWEIGMSISENQNQFKFEISDKEYFIDLLLFHRRLQC